MKTKILIIESGKGAGGSAFSMFRIVKYLDKSRYDPFVFVYYGTPVFSDIEKLGVPVTRLPVYSLGERLPDTSSPLRKLRNYIAVYGTLLVESLLNGFRLARFIRRNKIDLVHCNNGFFENFAAAFAARISGVACVSHVRGTEPLVKVEKICRNWIDRFIVLNDEMFQLYSGVFGPEKVRLIFNGVDLDEFANPDPQRVRDEFGLPGDAFCIGTFARLVEGKGVPELLRAFARVAPLAPGLRLFVAGSGSDESAAYADSLAELARELDIDDRVIFAGWRDDVRDCMAAMDLVAQISTTYPEGMSLAPIEAMTLSKPVIVSDNPGYANVVEDGVSGFIVAAGNVEQLAERMEKLVTDPTLAQRLADNARQRVLAQFEYGIVVERVQAVYREAMQLRPGEKSLHADRP